MLRDRSIRRRRFASNALQTVKMVAASIMKYDNTFTILARVVGRSTVTDEWTEQEAQELRTRVERSLRKVDAAVAELKDTLRMFGLE